MDTKTTIAAALIILTIAHGDIPLGAAGQFPAAMATNPILADKATPIERPRIVFHGATPVEEERMLRAIGRYEDLGLELPSLDIHFASDCQERFGAWGRFQHDSGTPWRIDVCTTSVYLHELAHAWDLWNLTDAERRMFVEVRGLEAWQGDDVPWDERGIEDLAILVARVVGQGVENYRSEDRLSDLHDFARITGVTVPDEVRAELIDSQDGSPQY